MPQMHNPNRETIVAMRRDGKTLQEVADNFGITRERVRQLCIQAGLVGCGKLGHLMRSETVKNKFVIQQFITRADGHKCPVCGADRKPKALLCDACKEFLKTVRTLKSRIRAYRDTGRGIYLNNACYLIRKYDIKPEDLEII